MATGGDIIEITFNHPTLGTGVFTPKGGVDSTYDLGGFRSDDDDSGIAGNGTMIDKINRKRWSFEVEVMNDMNEGLEFETANDLAADPQPADFTITHVNGTVYSGSGKVVGDLKLNGNNTTFTLKISGGGKLKAI